MLATDVQLHGITQTLIAVTGAAYELKRKEAIGDSLFVVWDAGIHVRYALSLEAVDYRRARISLGIDRDVQPLETRLEETLERSTLRALLDDPRRLVRILLGQSRYPG